MLISICVATYQRPEGLKRLMGGLDRLIFNHHQTPQIEVIVVDNDPNCSAREFCEQLKSNFKWSLKYFREPQRGVSYARNKAVAEVAIDTDFVSFIDDDQVPESSWLEELLTTQKIYNADVVAGPYLPFFPAADVPQWVIKGKFFDSPRYPTGHLLKFTGTGNVLIRAQILREMDKMRAINQGAGSMALQLSYRALASHWRILLEEPRRTLLTLSAACLLLLLPQTLYRQIQTLAFETVSAAQKRRLSYHE